VNLAADLQWVVSAPNLFADEVPHTVTNTERWRRFSTMDLNSISMPFQRILTSPYQKSKRLGLYYEYLLGLLLRAKYGAENVLTNVQVRSHDFPTTTIGEMDFVFHDGVNLHHWETMVKFYIHIPQLTGWSSLVGPGLQDRLDLKATQLFDRQLALSHTPEAQQLLPFHWQGLPLVTSAFAQGCVFKQWGSNAPLPSGVNPDVAVHQWPAYWCTEANWYEMVAAIGAVAMCPVHSLDRLTGPDAMPLCNPGLPHATVHDCNHFLMVRNSQIVARVLLMDSADVEAYKLRMVP
jgi:hypothetical protein